MNPSERAHMVLQSGGEPNHMEDWCGVFLDGLDGLEPSPTIERAAAAAAAAAAASRELLSPVDDETAFRRVRSVVRARIADASHCFLARERGRRGPRRVCLRARLAQMRICPTATPPPPPSASLFRRPSRTDPS
jgi:hypothetical protein